jgi:alpha-glucosidase
MDSSNSSFQFVRVDQFTPNSRVSWISFGPVAACTRAGNTFTLTGVSPATGVPAPVLKIYILGPKAFRVRFNPKGDYTHDGSFAVVNSNLGAASINVLQQDAQKLSVDLGGIRLDVLFQPMTIQVYQNGQMISTDTDQGLVYIPGKEAVANFKKYPANANYFGFGEKGGKTLRMNETSMTFFNYDNFQYSGSNVVPPGSTPGPLNPSEPLYNSIPFLIEDNPNPLDANGQPTHSPYSYGIFLDNESQSYFNIGASSAAAGNMYGKYYFGALYGEIDYYFLAGADTQEVIQQYVTLTGPPALPPMWVLGYHQGCYGYYDHNKVMAAALAYRSARIPIDGIHIDVDFQNNYRTFTASPKKFPNGGQTTFKALADNGFKASVNITGIVTIQPLDEDGVASPYDVLQSGLAQNAFILDVREDAPAPPNPGIFVTNENYGCNAGSNPYPAPGHPYDPTCTCSACTPLGTYGYYADLGKLDVRQWWGTQYKPLLDAGLEMVWQDMTDPATQASVSDSMPWKTLALNLLVYDFTTDSMTAHARIHNVFSLNLISATYEGLVNLRKQIGVDKRPFIIARGGYAGVQRYAATWTGDSASDWNFLSILMPEILNFGLSGQPLAGADVGGFATSSVGGDDPANGTGPAGNPPIQNGQVIGSITDPELLVRWTTMSAFFGWFRNHYDGYTKQYQEPYAYGEPYTSICRKYIEIRYKLLQLFYDALYESTQTGIPICRPMFLTDRSDPNVYQHLDDQFMVGQNLLIAPVIQRGSQSRDVYLPAGSSWYAYTDNQAPLQGPSTGGQSINWFVPLDLVPMYVRAGAIIPHREVEQFVGQLPQNPLTFDIYPGPDSNYMLYLDDKVSTQAQAQGIYRLTEVSQFLRVDAARVQTVSLARKYDKFTPAEPYYFVAMLDTAAPVSVAVNGNLVPVIAAGSDSAGAAQLAASAVNACYYNTSLRTTFVKVFDVTPQTQIVGTFPV